MRTETAVREFLDAKAGLSPRTLEQYREALGVLGKRWRDLPTAPGPLRAALAGVKSVWARDSLWRAWSAFFHWCAKEYGTPNPMERVERPKRPDVEMRALEPQELSLALGAARVVRDKAVLALGLDCGVRGSEFGRLRKVDVGLDTLRIWGKGNRQARVPISPEARHLLQQLANQVEGPYIFTGPGGRPLTRFGVYRIVRRCLERAGIPGPKLGPHCLRHSLGMNYIASGGDPFSLQRILRHRHINTTSKYVNLAMKTVVEQHARHSPLREALRGSQGVLWKQVEEILEKTGEKEVQ